MDQQDIDIKTDCSVCRMCRHVLLHFKKLKANYDVLKGGLTTSRSSWKELFSTGKSRASQHRDKNKSSFPPSHFDSPHSLHNGILS